MYLGMHPDQTVVLRWAAFLELTLRMDGAWLANSGNRTEMTLGTFSMASRVASFCPLAQVMM